MTEPEVNRMVDQLRETLARLAAQLLPEVEPALVYVIEAEAEPD